ncbi:MAG TPA: response regulator [Candidatus Acidoferrales bacterium]|nr:response regulator [Candidatus Acidoferrales bacterium]
MMKSEAIRESGNQNGARKVAPNEPPTRALVVGDEEAMSALIKEALVAADLDTVTLTTSTEAAARFRDEKFDVILVDLCAPPVDASKLIQGIRHSGFNRKTPIIMISDDLRPAALSEGFRAGASFFVYKPVDRAHLMNLIRATKGAVEQEKRRFRRVAVRAKVQVKCGDKTVEGETIDISPNGALVRVPRTFPVGSSVEISLFLPAGRAPVAGSGRVMRLVEGNQMGIQLESLPVTESGRLQEYLLSLAGV